MMISSLQNPRIKQAVALRERRSRRRSGLMRVEGFEELSLALSSGVLPAHVFFCPGLMREEAAQPALLQQLQSLGVECLEVSVPVFEKLAYRENPDGWLAVCPLISRRLDSLQVPGPPFLLVAERVEKPGNLGAMLRTADAAGVGAVIAADPVTDWGNPNIVRASKGALFSVPVAEASSSETLDWLRARGVQIVAATPEADLLYTEPDLRAAVAIAVGAEKQGLSESWLQAADLAVRIPMFGRVNSLNVAGAAALLLYEVVRQRGSGRPATGRG